MHTSSQVLILLQPSSPDVTSPLPTLSQRSSCYTFANITHNLLSTFFHLGNLLAPCMVGRNYWKGNKHILFVGLQQPHALLHCQRKGNVT